MKALEKIPANRFQSMEEFSAALGDPAWFGSLQPVRLSAQMQTVTGANMTGGGNTGRGAAIGSTSGIRPTTTLSGSASEMSQPMSRVSSSLARWAVGGAGPA